VNFAKEAGAAAAWLATEARRIVPADEQGERSLISTPRNTQAQAGDDAAEIESAYDREGGPAAKRQLHSVSSDRPEGEDAKRTGAVKAICLCSAPAHGTRVNGSENEQVQQ
jgi:hypothetical protein